MAPKFSLAMSYFLLLWVLMFTFLSVESKICPRCIPKTNGNRTLIELPKSPINVTEECLYPPGMHPKILELDYCVYIIPLRDHYLSFHYPLENDHYFEVFWKENKDRCEKYFNQEAVGFYNFDKYGNLPTDVLFSCSNGANSYNGKIPEDKLNNYLSHLVLSYVKEMEGKYDNREMRCYDRDSDLVNSHWTLPGCMFAIMNRTFAVGPVSFNTFYTDEISNIKVNEMKETFLFDQGNQSGCAPWDKNGYFNVSSTYLKDGECTGSLNLWGFNILCCCYTNVTNCLYTANVNATINEEDLTVNEVAMDDLFLCIKGTLNASNPEYKFRGPRSNVLTELSPYCYIKLVITKDKGVDFNLSLTFGADQDTELCANADDNSQSIYHEYLKSPWGYSANFSAQSQPIEIVRCCKGHFCNHFGMYADDEASKKAWPKQFQYKMGKDGEMKCGYLPADIFWNFFRPEMKCARVISETKTQEIQSEIGGRDLARHVLHYATELPGMNRTENFTDVCFYAGITSSVGCERSGCDFQPKMVFGCLFKDSISIPYDDHPDFNYRSNLHHQKLLRNLSKQYEPHSRCLSTEGTSMEALSFLRVDKYRKLKFMPMCYAMVYRDFDRVFFQTGPCTSTDGCCQPGYWADYFENYKEHEGLRFVFNYSKVVKHAYRCESAWCHAENLDAQCLLYAGIEYDAATLYAMLRKHTPGNYGTGSTGLSIRVRPLTGYNSDFVPEKSKLEFARISTTCVNDESCFDQNSMMAKYNVESMLPFCSFLPQRQYGANYVRNLVAADSSALQNRTRFELFCEFDSQNMTYFDNS